jgi:hypothetical protein
MSLSDNPLKVGRLAAGLAGLDGAKRGADLVAELKRG